ncbi:Hypothetical predicted protein [Octopus vulgaris]|uniref:Uncharacterized protein n=1 Tax=Octopus vulgaris TaxID=6645 RepID=A0AA36B4C7_OCTVU|nr:Hypothetical predicted protein [Octopus vulgaris]
MRRGGGGGLEEEEEEEEEEDEAALMFSAFHNILPKKKRINYDRNIETFNLADNSDVFTCSDISESLKQMCK